MNSYSTGDLVWVPDGTQNNYGFRIGGPTYGLVTAPIHRTQPGWVNIKIGNREYLVHESKIRKIES